MSNKPISTPSRTKEILNKYGLHAKKGYGQNFLIDWTVSERIAANVSPEGGVIEIGPGIGSLTEQLAKQVRKVRSYEVDESLLPVLREELKEYDNVEIILQDFLEVDTGTALKDMKEECGSIDVAANLPYYITTPVLFKLFESPIEFPHIVVMIQKEVADRFAALPGSAEYGALSVEGQYMYEVKKLFNVPRTAFNPAPNVESAVIKFTRREVIDDVSDREEFFTFVKACFKQRRKTLYNNLREYFGDFEKAASLIERAGLAPGCRAQELEVRSFLDLFRLFGEE